MGKWQQKVVEGKSSTGKPFRVLFKPGKVNKLLINFLGGGLSWNAETAARPFSVKSMMKKQEAFYISDVAPLQLKLVNTGLVSAKDERNPFLDWNMVNIPYVSGDFHIGNSDFEYIAAKGKPAVLHHHGQKNVEAALKAVKELCPQSPDVIVIMGLSAGGHGCLAHAPHIHQLFPECKRFIVYSEGAHIKSPLWADVVQNVWKIKSEMAKYVTSDVLVDDLFCYAKDNMPPNTMFLQSNSAWDKALTEFMHKMNHGTLSINTAALNEFYQSLLSSTKLLKQEIPNYYYFLTNFGKSPKDGTTPHVFAGTPRLVFDAIQEGVSIADWLVAAVSGETEDIGTDFIST